MSVAKTNQMSPRLLQSAIKASRMDLVFVGVFSFFVNLLMLTGPLFMLQIYDRVLASHSIQTLAILFILVVLLYLAFGLLDFTRSRILSRIGAQVDSRIEEFTFKSLIYRRLTRDVDEVTTSPLVELNTIRQFLSGQGVVAFFDAPWVPLYLFMIFVFHQGLGFLALVAALVLFAIAILNDLSVRKPIEKTSRHASIAHNTAIAGERNAEVLVAMSMLAPLLGRWRAQRRETLGFEFKARDRALTLSATTKSLRLLFQSAMLAAGAALVIFGELSPGVMIAASIILGRALSPVEQAITHWRGFVQFWHSARKLERKLNALPIAQKRMELPKPRGKLEVRNLQVCIPGTRNLVLRNVNFSLDPGRILGVVGRSASGKSSLVRTLVGVWKQAGGEVRLDGAELDQWDPAALGPHIGYLPQDVELFDGTIQENISRMESSPDAAEVVRAAKLAGIHEMVLGLGGYDTQIGQFGTHLSSGQRQRVALARALYGDPVLVVLDEPNSNLDDQGEAALAVALKAVSENGQTVVIVSHKVSVLRIVDELLELTDGSQTEFGSKDEVIANIKRRSSSAKVSPQSGNVSSLPIEKGIVPSAVWRVKAQDNVNN